MSQQTDNIFIHQNFFDEFKEMKARIRTLETAVSQLAQFNGLLIGEPGVTAVAEQIRLYRNTILMGQLSHEDDTWLLLNQDAGKDIKTPQLIRADGGLAAGDVSPGANSIGYTGGLIARRGGVDYTGYPYVRCRPPLTSTAWDGDTKTSANNGTLDLSAVFGVPPGVAAVNVRLSGQVATVSHYIIIGPGGSDGNNHLVVYPQVSGIPDYASGLINCNDNGDLVVTVNGTVTNVVLFITGYFM